MAVVLRLSRAGTHKAPFYHVVATDSRKPRDGSYLEDVGHVRPDPEARRSSQLKVERVEHWLKAGARPSQTVAMLLKRAKAGQARRRRRPRPPTARRARPASSGSPGSWSSTGTP